MAQVKRHWFSRLSFAAAVLITAALLALSYASALVNPARFWLFSLAGLLYVPLALSALFFLVWSIRRRARIGWILALTLLPSLFLAGRYYQVRKAPEKAGSVKIVSYNVGLFAHGQQDGQRLQTADSIAAWLRTLDADVICLQEFYLPNSLGMDAWLHHAFPGYHPDYYVLTGKNGHAGNVTLSRLPVEGKGKMVFEKSTNMALYTDINLDTAVVRIYNCHLESYNISPEGVIRSIGGEDAVVETTGRKMRHTIERRPAQVEAVVRSMKESPVHSLVLGDFNDVPMSYTYQRLKAGRKDSFVAAGQRLSATYTKFGPFLRIDYILYPRDLEAVSYAVAKVRYSDHYPVIATYR